MNRADCHASCIHGGSSSTYIPRGPPTATAIAAPHQAGECCKSGETRATTILSQRAATVSLVRSRSESSEPVEIKDQRPIASAEVEDRARYANKRSLLCDDQSRAIEIDWQSRYSGRYSARYRMNCDGEGPGTEDSQFQGDERQYWGTTASGDDAGPGGFGLRLSCSPLCASARASSSTQYVRG